MFMGVFYTAFIAYASLHCAFIGVYIHSVGFCVARSIRLGNAKASKCGTGNRYRLPRFFWGSRNLVGIAIQLSDSEEEEFFVGYPMLISPEKFDFGIERFGCGI